MRWYPASATSETYKLNIATFEKGKQDKFLALTKKSKTVIDGTVSIPVFPKL